MKKLLQASLAVILTSSLGSSAFAIGGANIGNECPSARAAGQGYVGVAGQNNDPTAVFINPAAMTNLKGTQITVGAHFENVNPSYESDAGQTTKADATNALVPNFSMTQSFLDGRLGAGLSIQSPFGLETHWGGNSPLRYVATDSRLAMTEIMPAVAFKVNEMFSIGAGVKYVNLFDAQLDRKVNVDAVNAALGSFGTGSTDANSSLQGQAADWGYHAGIVVQPNEKHAVGVTFHSKINLRVNGNVTLRNMSGAMAAVFGGNEYYSTSAYTDIVLPQNVQMGYAYKPTQKWHLEANAAWYHWSESKDLNVRFAETDATRLLLLNQGNPAAFDNRDAWSFATGANYIASDKWQFRGGVWYEPWALPENNFNPAFNDLSRYGISAGTGVQLTKNMSLDAAYTAVFFHNRTIHNNVGSTTSGIPNGGIPGLGVPDADIDGTYKNFANLIALNLSYRFGNK